MSEKGDDVALAAAAVTRGEAIVYPTETVYGIGVDATSKAAVERLIAVKGRDGGKGMSVLVADMQAAACLVAGDLPGDAVALMRAYWPGPLTIVLPAAETVNAGLIGPSGGVGLRCAADAMAARLLDECGVPLTSTSANPSGQAPAQSAAQAQAYFGNDVAYYLDDGERRSSAASTVIEFVGTRVHVRRDGAVPRAELARYVVLSN